MKFFSVLTVLLFIQPAYAAPKAPPVDVNKIIDELATPLTEERLFYRWQSTTSGENLHKAGKMTKELDDHFMAMKEMISAGPGIYMAGAPASSSAYLPKEGGNLLEIRIAKGTRVLNLRDPKVLAKLKEYGYDAKSFSYEKFDRPILFNYSIDWFVGKNLKDRATFELYPGKQASRDRVADIFHSLGLHARAQDQTLAQLETHRPDLHKLIREEPIMGDHLSARLASQENMIELFRKATQAGNHSFDSSEAVESLIAMPDKGAYVFNHPEVSESLKQRLIENSSGWDFAMLSKDVPDDWMADYMVKGKGQNEFFRNFVKQIRELSVEEMVRRTEALEKGVRRLTGRDAFTDEMKAQIAEMVSLRIASTRKGRVDGTKMQALLRAEFLPQTSISPLAERLQSSESYRLAYENMLNRLDAPSVQEMLNKLQNYGEFDSVVSQVGAKKPEVLKEVMNRHPDLYAKIVEQDVDIVRLPRVTARLAQLDIHVGAINAEQLARLPASERMVHLLNCIEAYACRKMASGHWSTLLEGIDDLRPLSLNMRAMQASYKNESIESEIFSAIKTRGQLTTFYLLDKSSVTNQQAFQKLKQIGVENLRPHEIGRLVDIDMLSSTQTRELMTRSLQSVLNPDDAITLREQLKNTGLDKTELSLALDKKMKKMGASADEIKRYWTVGKKINRSMKPSESFDCVGSWARALSR